jgi:NAD(P)-dependent dehydrogenase (short-subunit alcohol dehydrogenase family)
VGARLAVRAMVAAGTKGRPAAAELRCEPLHDHRTLPCCSWAVLPLDLPAADGRLWADLLPGMAAAAVFAAWRAPWLKHTVRHCSALPKLCWPRGRRRAAAGVIMVTSSAGGVYPMPLAPVYSAAKAGAVMAVQSLAQRLIKKYGIRITALCPQVRGRLCAARDVCLGRGVFNRLALQDAIRGGSEKGC